MIDVSCSLFGLNFYPSQLNIDCKIELAIDSGEINKRNRVSGGHCILCAPEIKNSEKILWMAFFIRKHLSKFKKAGVTDITFNITWSGRQGNMEFTHAELKSISRLNIPLTITYTFN